MRQPPRGPAAAWHAVLAATPTSGAARTAAISLAPDIIPTTTRGWARQSKIAGIMKGREGESKGEKGQ
jgi:hypothetical protein